MGTVGFTGPEPPPGRIWCAVCAMLAKAAANTANKAAIERIERGEPDGVVEWLEIPKLVTGLPKMAFAVTRAIYPPLGNALLDVCWSHCGGIEFTSIMPAAAMPGMPPGLGGAIDLSARR